MHIVAIETREVDVPGYGKKVGRFLRFEPESWLCIEIRGRTFNELFDKNQEEKNESPLFPGHSRPESSAREFLSRWGGNPRE